MQTEVQYDKIVCDNGTGYLKMGFAGDSFPRYHIPTIVGRPMLRANQNIGAVELKDIMFGDEAAPYRALLDIKYPVAHGKVDNWDDFTQLWEYTFKERMGVKNIAESRILVTEAALNPKKNREKMAQVIFEHFGFSHCMFESQAVLSLMCEGHSTGIVFDSGDGVSHVIPVVDGYIMDHSITRLNLAGRDITKYLVRLLLESGYAFNSSADFELVREIKEQVCFVSYDPKKDRKLAEETTLLDKEYTLPDKTCIKVSRERYQAAECLFNPSLAGIEDAGIHHKVFQSLQQCDIDNFLPLVQNIIMTGGTSMFPGLSTRMYKELAAVMTKEKYKGDATRVAKTGMTVHDPPRRKNAVFIGGSFLANNAPEEQWISRKEWQEKGAKCVHKQN